MVVSMTDVRQGQPLPLLPPDATIISNAAAICEDDSGGMAFIFGIATFAWGPDDICGRRLAAVQLVEVAAAKPGAVASGFGVGYSTLWRWREVYANGGTEALAALPKGPKGPSKLTAEKLAEIARLRAQGGTIAEVATRTGLSPRSVAGAPARTDLGPGSSGTEEARELVPLARPVARAAERQAARAGVLTGAEVVFTEGASLPLVGTLVIVPALVATGLLAVTDKVYDSTRAAFYTVRQLVLSFAFATLLGAGRAERAGRIDPASIGRLVGLDRGPVAETLRRRFAELGALGRSGELWGGLAAHHLARAGLPDGLIYLDGHVRAYHGRADLPKAHLARMRIAMAGTEDAWLTDALGEAVLCWTPAPGSGLVAELRRAVKEMRGLLADGAPLTIVFDRGGWSPATFAELVADGVDICTYRKAPKTDEPRVAFSPVEVTDAFGHAETYLLCDRPIEIPYDSGRKAFSCRQVTRLDEKSGHQTQIVTSRRDLDPGPLARAMFGRWSEENFFRYGRARFFLDGLDTYAKISDDPSRLVPNPRKRAAAAQVKAAKRELALAHATQNKATLEGAAVDNELAGAFAGATAHVETLRMVARAIPAKVPLGSVHREASRLDPERKRLCDAIRISAYNAETTLSRMLRPHYSRAEDEARTLLQEIYAASADVEIVNNELHVRIEPLSAPHRTRALVGLCEDLTATETTYPGTDLTLIYEVKER